MAYIRMVRIWLRKYQHHHLVALAVIVLLLLYIICVPRTGRVLDDRDPVKVPSKGKRTSNIESLIKFKAVNFNPDLDNLTFDNAHLYPCSQPNGPGPDGVVDLMCVPRPKYLPTFKNPCHRDGSPALKCMPYYNILGFDKCGTTDLSSRLTSHPSILKCTAYMGKEIYYWGWLRLGIFLHKRNATVWTLDNYASAFREAAVAIASKEGQPCQPVVGDGGPIDAWDFRGWDVDPQNRGLSEPKVLTPHHMRHMLEHPRLIILMREPVERLYSDYFFTGAGTSPEKFDKDVTTAINMMNACLRVNDTRLCFFSEYLSENMPTRLHISCYSIFLREWLSVFHRKHFLFLRTEDYKKDTRGTLEAVFAFLGVETLPESTMEPIVQQKKAFETGIKTWAGPMLEKTRQKLKDFYAPCNANLRELLGDDKYLWLDT